MQHLQPDTTLQGGKYRIERVLGQGGFGNTYVGYNTEFEETVAIKEFFMKGVRALNKEAPVIKVSSKTGEGFDEVAAWIDEKAGELRHK